MKSALLAGLAATTMLVAAPAFAQTAFPNPVPFVAGTAASIATAPFAIIGGEGRSTFRPGMALSDTPNAPSDILSRSPSPAHPEGPDDDADIGG